MPEWMSESIDQLAAALVVAQAAFPTVTKDANNPFFNSRYATMDAIVAATRPILKENGLAVVQQPTGQGLRTTIVHESGQWISELMDLLIGGKQDAQAHGSAITYSRRYAYCAALGITTGDDDDGAQASGTAAPATAGPAATVRDKVAQQAMRASAVKATKTQRDKITKLAEELALDVGAVAKNAGADSVADLTATQANEVIRDLQAQQREAQKPFDAAEKVKTAFPGASEDPPF